MRGKKARTLIGGRGVSHGPSPAISSFAAQSWGSGSGPPPDGARRQSSSTMPSRPARRGCGRLRRNRGAAWPRRARRSARRPARRPRPGTRSRTFPSRPSKAALARSAAPSSIADSRDSASGVLRSSASASSTAGSSCARRGVAGGAIEPIERRLALRDQLRRPFERLAVVGRQQREAQHLALWPCSSSSPTLTTLPSDFDILLAAIDSMPLCSQ